MENMEVLANAVILQAVKDLEKSLSELITVESYKTEINKRNFWETYRFFKSKQFKIYSKLNGQVVADKIISGVIENKPLKDARLIKNKYYCTCGKRIYYGSNVIIEKCYYCGKYWRIRGTQKEFKDIREVL